MCRIARICNQQKQAAKLAGEQSSLLFLALFLREPVQSDAAVIDVKDRSMDVVVKDFGVVLRVYTDVSVYPIRWPFITMPSVGGSCFQCSNKLLIHSHG